MAKVEKSIDINVPLHAAYNQWTQFEDFPQFMDGVQEVRQIDDRRLHWKAQVGGKVREWDAEIQEQLPDSRIAWHSTSGSRNAGQVTFQQLGDQSTRVTLLMDYEPEGVMEKAGDMLGVLSTRVQGDLGRFKDFIESRGSETGAWRGEIHGGQTKQGPSRGTSGNTGSGQGSSSNLNNRPGGSKGTPESKNVPGSSASRSGGIRVDPESGDDSINPDRTTGNRRGKQ